MAKLFGLTLKYIQLCTLFLRHIGCLKFILFQLTFLVKKYVLQII